MEELSKSLDIVMMWVVVFIVRWGFVVRRHSRARNSRAAP
jgi:hypothetical protein